MIDGEINIISAHNTELLTLTTAIDSDMEDRSG
jgi:hypothetical protein